MVMPVSRRATLGALGAGIGVALALTMLPPARAAEPVPVVATFSILGDIVKNIGGDRVAVTTLVGPDGDTHVYSPTPRDAQAVADARLIFANGLGYEGWMDRLTEAAGSHGRVVVVSEGMELLMTGDEGAHGHEDHHKDENRHAHEQHEQHAHDRHQDGHAHHEDHKSGHGHDDHKDEHAHGNHDHDHDHGPVDPHGWHDPANARVYAANIAEALSEIDPAGRAAYEANRDAYAAALDALDSEARAMLAALPGAPHRVVVPHLAFAYLERAYGVEFVSPQGLSTEAEASAGDVARMIREIRAQDIDALFIENIADPRLIEQIQRETDARVGGTLYSGALSGPDGPASTYLDLMRHNIRTIAAALR